MSYTEIFNNEEIFKAFEQPFGFFSIVTQNNESEMLCKDLPNLEHGVWPVYAFAFLTPDGYEICDHLLIYHDGGQLHFRTTKDTPLLLDFGENLDDELELFKPAGIFDLTRYVSPVDPIAQFVDRRVNKVTLVRFPDGALIGLLIWFEIGSRIALTVGSLSELILLFGEHVDLLYEEAVRKRGYLNLKIETKEFRPPDYNYKFFSSNPWFEF